MDDYDIFSPMFDESLHNNEITPSYISKSKMCGYCGHCFHSRNQLFYHLGYHNIDIGTGMDHQMKEDDELGDYGWMPNLIKKKKRNKNRKWRLKSSLNKKRKYKNKKEKRDLLELLENMRLIDHKKN